MPSIQLSIESVDQAGGCMYGYSCVYTDTMSWKHRRKPSSDGQRPANGVRSVVWRRQVRNRNARSDARRDRSILDWLSHRVSALKTSLGPADRQRMDEYLENSARSSAGSRALNNRMPSATLASFQPHLSAFPTTGKNTSS